jgi:hypothetical protein
MNAKLGKRVVYGIVAAMFLYVAGRDAYAAGLDAGSALMGGGGLILAYMAISGAG